MNIGLVAVMLLGGMVGRAWGQVYSGNVLASQVTATSSVTAPGFAGSVDRTYSFPRTTSSTGAVVVANGDTGIVIIGTTTRFNGSNSGIQYNSDVANRAQIRLNAYGNHTGVSGMTCSKSRGDFGTDVSLLTGDVICRQTVSAAAGTPGSKPNVADASFEAATINATTMGVNYNLRLMNNAGTLATKFFVTSEGAGSLAQGLTASSVTVSGDISASLSSVTASGFFGDGYGIKNYAVVSSTESNSSPSVASTIFVGIATNTTPSFRGSRPLLILAVSEIDNNSGGQRDYTCRLTQDSVALSRDQLVSATGTFFTTIVMTRLITSTSGIHDIALLCRSSSVSGAQIAVRPYISVLEL